jgi:hypothetical protein
MFLIPSFFFDSFTFVVCLNWYYLLQNIQMCIIPSIGIRDGDKVHDTWAVRCSIPFGALHERREMLKTIPLRL